jgi:hypothetical protein
MVQSAEQGDLSYCLLVVFGVLGLQLDNFDSVDFGVKTVSSLHDKAKATTAQLL